jgi:predicted site-specific integrase-resolvase
MKGWAAAQGVSYDSARRWYQAGKLPVPAYQAGRLIVIGEPVRPGTPSGSAVVYARVLALLRDKPVSTIVVEHRDRFARFGAECMEAAMAASGCWWPTRPGWTTTWSGT